MKYIKLSISALIIAILVDHDERVGVYASVLELFL
jgi:hypothetical protein